MRITKVKVDNKDVMMQRDSKEGFLKFGDEEKRENEIQMVFAAKQASFLESVLNKTVVKKPSFEAIEGTKEQKAAIKKERDSNIKQIRMIFEYVLYQKEAEFNKNIKEFTKKINITPIKALTKEDLNGYFGHKFQKELEYKNINKITFSLSDALFKALQKSKGADKLKDLKIISGALYQYSAWSDWYIKNKQKYLKKSIVNNKIDYQGNLSPRKRALEVWASNLVNNHLVDLTDLVTKFELQELVNKWNTRFENEIKQTNADVLKQTQLINEDIKAKKRPPKQLDPKNNGIPINLFEFKRKLKACLQCHQTKILDKLKNDPILNQYSLEVSKYLELYFPLKKSGKRLSATDIEYYLQFDTIKNRIESQIINATMQYLIQQGKAINYDLNAPVDSDCLRDIKTQETFALKFINACAFAANNLRNCIDPDQTQDILGKTSLGRVDICLAA